MNQQKTSSSEVNRGITCPTCQGTTVIFEPNMICLTDCPTCKGSGHVGCGGLEDQAREYGAPDEYEIDPSWKGPVFPGVIIPLRRKSWGARLRGRCALP